jgi:glutaminyl-tRNA synthetase
MGREGRTHFTSGDDPAYHLLYTEPQLRFVIEFKDGESSNVGIELNRLSLHQNRAKLVDPQILLETSLSRISKATSMEAECKRDFLQNQTATCISATLKPYASILAWQLSLAASAICVSTIPILQKKKQEYVDAIMDDVHWLGFQWDGLFYASDYFQQLYEWAIQLIKAGKAYVCDLSADEIREYRGTLTEPGRESPYRNRSVEESLDLFERMKNGEFPDGSRTLRARIDMSSPNLNLRDPVMYRILHMDHHRTGNQWCIYPMYDYAHGQSDSIERVTHSMCTLEFDNNRPLYNWFIEQLGIFPSRQYEFDRLALTHTLLSKRKLLKLVEEGHVEGWDDPRMPTLSGMRRRGYTPEAIRNFISSVGVSKTNGITQLQQLEYFLRQNLNQIVPRVMCVQKPLRVVIENYPDDLVEEMDAINNPEDSSAGIRKIPFSKTLYIEEDDFREDPPKQFYRLTPGREVRLRICILDYLQ